MENTNTTIHNNKRSLDEVGNNIQFRFQDGSNNNNVIPSESLRNNIGHGVNDRDSIGNTNTFNNNKRSIDEGGNNIQIELQDGYYNNNIINHESPRNSVGSGVNDRNSVGNTNASINHNNKRINEVGNNIQLVMNHKSFRNSVRRGDSVGNTNASINNIKKKMIDEVGNNINNKRSIQFYGEQNSNSVLIGKFLRKSKKAK